MLTPKRFMSRFAPGNCERRSSATLQRRYFSSARYCSPPARVLICQQSVEPRPYQLWSRGCSRSPLERQVRNGSNATEPFGAGADQCLLFPASDQIVDKSRMTKRARKRLMQCSKQHRHSITSSARASNEGDTVRPSVLAVLRLITNAYLVGACTGRSAGFSPLRTRST